MKGAMKRVRFDYWEEDRGILRMYKVEDNGVKVFEFILDRDSKIGEFRERTANRDELVMLCVKFIKDREMFRKVSQALAQLDRA